MNEPKYAYPYPAQGGGYYQGPPVMAPPQYAAPPPPRREPGFLEGWYVFIIPPFFSSYFHPYFYGFDHLVDYYDAFILILMYLFTYLWCSKV
uniref:Uncharacterized protein n=1 Tax=Lactuca sativa TaxID=4236 RepID=A0A9R1W1B0_LACSA|nr:hypothetical protein LSAT_V11C300133240 [Lactuca sativa]